MADLKVRIAKRCAKEFKDGDFVNLGIGLPTQVADYIPDDIIVTFHSENGFAGIDAVATENPDVDIIISTSMPTYMSYRTSKDLPILLGEVASRIAGGGGHPKAAGSNVNMEFINKVLDTKTDTISI